MSFQKKEQREQSKRTERKFLKSVEKDKIDKIARNFNKKNKTKAIAEARDRKQKIETVHYMDSFDFGNDQEYIRHDPTAFNFWHKEVEESAVKSQMKASSELYEKIVSYMNPEETKCDWDDAFNSAVLRLCLKSEKDKIKEQKILEKRKIKEQKKQVKTSNFYMILQDNYV
jgi:hypothetical protein